MGPSLGVFDISIPSSESESTGLTPNMLMLGREVRTPLELQFGHTSEQIGFYGDYVNGLRSRLQMAHDICRRYLAKTAKRRKDICHGVHPVLCQKQNYLSSS